MRHTLHNKTKHRKLAQLSVIAIRITYRIGELSESHWKIIGTCYGYLALVVAPSVQSADAAKIQG